MSQVEQARKSFIEHALNEIRNIPHYSNFKRSTYYVIAKLGLQRKAKEEKLFETGDWTNTEHREELIERLKFFLIKHIK